MGILVVSLVLPVYAQTASVPEAFQGLNSNSGSMSTFSFLEWTLNYQDGSETGTTQFATTSFQPFPFSFVPESETFRTLITAEVRGVTSFTGIGDSFCYTLPSWTYNVDTVVNGKNFKIPKQFTGFDDYNESTAISKKAGVKFTPELIERLLEIQGVILQSGDVVTWKVTANNRYTLFTGEVSGGTCQAVRGTAFDGYAVGMSFQQTFVWLDPLDQLIRPTTGLPDLDGDGIPDVDDQCDFSPERFNGFQDEDGCPDLDPIGFDPTSITDQDGDGILDVDDLCPNTPEIFNGIQDGDGCPDGAVLDVDFSAVPITEPIIPLVETAPIIGELPTFEEIVGVEPVPIDEIELIEDNPMTMLHVEETISDNPMVTQGISDVCENATQDCIEIISQAIQMFEATTGIMLPFAPTLLNLILVLGAIVGIILIMTVFIRRRR